MKQTTPPLFGWVFWWVMAWLFACLLFLSAFYILPY